MNIKPGQIWRVKQYTGKFVNIYLLVTRVISRDDPNWHTQGTTEKYCKVVNIENNSEHFEWISPDKDELMTHDYLP